MNYGAIKKLDIANGPGLRVSLFVSGCTHHCPGCFNPETWDFSYGKPFTQETEEELLALLASPYVDGLTLLGGEPFEPVNQQALLPFLRKVRALYSDKTVWCYTGYTLEALWERESVRCEATDELLSLLDVLVDGEFVERLKNIRLKFRGSENQRILDMRRSLLERRPVVLPAYL